MNTNRESAGASRIHGNLLRAGNGREVAIYKRDGVVAVAEIVNGSARLFTVSEWSPVNGRKLVNAHRRGEVEIIAPIPDEIAQRIERLHRSQAAPGNGPFARFARFALGVSERFTNGANDASAGDRVSVPSPGTTRA